MPGELESVAMGFVAALDAMDLDRMMESALDDAQGIDEISRRWIRGREELDGYLRGLMGAVSNVRTELRDVEERMWGDTGMVTCWLEQDYELEGNSQHVSAPTTIVMRRQDGEWKLALFHSAPLPEEG
ncbi:MAG TPA: nuclear transport factor 2 family protein [Gaiellaceae bacterium]|jgi:ketosteroid isomerase-like protein|nr:nuclear transport factor 2 family protein [Gaiellaceae bacterium]